MNNKKYILFSYVTFLKSTSVILIIEYFEFKIGRDD